MGGASSGKTFTIVRRIMARGLRAPGSRHAILRFRWNAARATVEPTDPDLERAGRSHHLDMGWGAQNEVTGSNSYSKMVTRYRQDLLAVHAAWPATVKD